MGLFRKTTSAMTLGVVDFRSDKERIARSSRQTAQAVKQQTKMMRADRARPLWRDAPPVATAPQPRAVVWRFQPAPGWPAPPHVEWLPDPGWTPDPSWPPAPAGWQFVVDIPVW